MNPSTARRRLTLTEALREFEWQAEHGVVDTGRYRCEYAAWGDGPPLIFIHGWCDSFRSSVLPMALLRHDFRCIAYSQPVGRKDDADLARYQHGHLVHDLFALMDHLGYYRASLIAHSFGSTVALKAMHQEPMRIGRATLVAGFASRPLVRGERWMANIGRYLPGEMNLLPWRSEALKRSHLKPFRQYDPDTFRYFFDNSGRIPIRAASHWALRINETDVSELLPEIRQPVLLVAGECDPLVPTSRQRQLFQQLPNAVLYLIDGCGHYPMFTHPQAMSEALLRFSRAPECALVGNAAPQAAMCPA